MGDATNPTIIEFLRRFSEISQQHPKNEEEDFYDQDPLRSDSEIEIEWDEDEEKERFRNFNEDVTDKRIDILDLLREKYKERTIPGKEKNKHSKRDPLTVHEVQKEKKKAMEDYKKKRKDLMSQKIDPETLKQRQKAQNEISTRHGLKPFVDTTKSDKEKAKQSQKLKKQKQKEFSEQTKKLNLTKAQTRKPKTEQPVEEKPPPQYDPYLHDFQQKIDREIQAYDKLIGSITEQNEEPYYDSASLFGKLNLDLNAAQTGADYHMRFAILFQQLEAAEERIDLLKKELE